MAYSAVAVGGKVYHLVAPGENQPPRLERVVPLKKVTLAVLSQALCECVDKGSGRRAAVPGISVAGKTGTAAAGDGSAVTQAWFAGYAPSDNPQVAVVIFLNRGTGGADAAPVAAEVFKAYFGRSGDAR
jgi:peptidoglycan glycosyltransferase